MSVRKGQTPLFHFEWPVDQAGYELVHMKGDGKTIVGSVEYDAIKPLGGPPRFYRPMDNPSLWRTFADRCENTDGALAFVREYGLLGQTYDRPNFIIELARVVNLIAMNIDHRDRKTAAAIFTAYARPHFTAAIRKEDSRFEIKVAPTSLASAILLQAGEAIISDRLKFRRCKNCLKWFHYGTGTGSTSRKEFCSPKCRVAWNRKHKRHANRSTIRRKKRK